MRIRPRFSLRTLFVVVTIIALPLGWVAYQLNWIRQRHIFLSTQTGWSANTAAPWPLGLFGETGVAVISVGPGVGPEKTREFEKIKRLFPEAGIYIE